MKTKLFSLFLALVASVGIVYSSVTIDGINYNLNDNELTAEVTSGINYSGNIVIPASVTYNSKTYNVTSIGNSAFSQRKALTSVTIPNSVTSIGNDAFKACSGLTSVKIGNNVTSIGDRAFYNCSTLTSVTIPNSVTSIGTSAFSGCSSLTSIILPNSVTSIGDEAFSGCSGLTSVTIPNSVTYIGAGAFRLCSSLTSVTLPNSVTSIGSSAFSGCSGLTSVTIPNSVTSIGQSAFAYCTGLTSIAIPNSVTSIGSGAFTECTGLTSVTIPNSVTSIGSGAFYHVANIVYNGTATGTPWGARSVNGYVDGDLVYEDATKTKLLACFSGATSITIGKSVNDIGKNAFKGCSSLTSIYWNVRDINDFASGNTPFFYNGYFDLRQQITTFGLGEDVQRIPNHLLDGMTNIVSVTLSNSIVSATYSQSNNLSTIFGSQVQSYTIGVPVTSIGDYAFYGCANMTTLSLPGSLTSIGDNTFAGCSGLTAIHLSDLATWCKIADFSSAELNPLYYAHKLYINSELVTNLAVPDGITRIGHNAFYGYTDATAISIPNSVTTIESSAFSGCSGVKTVTLNSNALVNKAYSTSSNIVKLFGPQVANYVIGENVTAVGNYAFYHSTNLQSLTIPSSIVSIGQGAYDGCSQLTQVSINSNAVMSREYSPNINFRTIFGPQVTTYALGDAITSIGDYAFYGCDNISSLNIPNGVTSIGNGAFYGCTGLASITIPSNVTSIGDCAFQFCTGISALNIPNITHIGVSAFADCVGVSSVQFGNSLVSLGDSAFSSCYSLPSVEFPNSLTSIGNYAFYQCNRIPSIDIPQNVTSLGDGAFKGCSKLTQVSINSNAVAGKNYNQTTNFASIFGPQVTAYTLGNTVSSIGDYAFYGCGNLPAITLPNTITRIGNNAYQNCSGLTSFNVPEGITSIQPNTFSGCTSLISVEFPSSLTMIGEYAFYQCNRIQAIDIPQNVTSLGDGAFIGCSKLTQVSVNSNAVIGKKYSQTENFASIFGPQVTTYTLGDGVTSIGDYAFYGCGNMSAITLPNTITNIGSNAFQNCTGFTSFNIPESVTNIEPNTFSGCTSLASVSIPNAVTTIKDSAFTNCSSLVISTLPTSVATLGNGAFSGCGSISSLAIPASLKTVGENAFADCAGIARVDIDSLAAWCNISFANSQANPLFYARNLYVNNELLIDFVVPDRITELKNWTFNNCSSLKSVFIPNTVRSVAATAFADCSNITDVVWHSKNTEDYVSFTEAPFYASSKKVTSFIFGDEVEHIPAYLCCGMSGLRSLAFPAYLKSIGDYAFKDLTRIKQINIPNEVETIGANAFDSCIFVTSIYLGYQVAEIGDNAFNGCVRVNDITCMNTTTPVVYDNTLTSISNYAYLYVQAGSKRTYQLDPYWSWFDIQEIVSEEATLTRDAVTVEANEDNAIFTWPTDSAAATYSLQITKDSVVFCTLVFNANGQLTGIAFAPGKNGNKQVPAATMSLAGMSFTVTGLNSASKYAYRLAVADDAKEEIVAYSGEFATTGYDGEIIPGGEPENLEDATDEVTASAIHGRLKVIRDGQLFVILPDGTKYSATGVKVE